MAYADPTNVTLADLAATLEECPPLTGDPARATTLAAALLAPVQERDAPPLLAAELPGVIERLGPERAPALLIRIAELARQPAASPARSAVARLGASEPVPLRVTEAWRVADEAAEAFAFDLRRGVLGEVESRAFVLLDRRVDPEGRLAVGCAGPPEDQQLAPLLTDLLDAPPEPVATEAAAAAIRRAWERTDAAGEAIPAELAVALTLLERPLLGAEEPPALRVDPSDVLYGEPDERLAVDVLENEEHAYATIDRLLDEYGEHAARLLADVDLPLPFVADSMLTYKVNYSDGLLGDWPPAELAAFLLDWWPRKVIAAPKTVHATLAAMLPFLAFLDLRDSLSGGSLAELADTLDELGEPFLDACEDVAGWEIARSLLASEQPPPAGHRGAHTDRRKRRKAARAARKRNRR